jgi:hypothetical protein
MSLNIYLILRNISSDSVEFLGHSEKEKYHEEGRFVTTYMALKIAELDPYKTNVQSAYLPKENVQGKTN